jgi:NADPH-dependent ferric siderophore reductase
VKGVSFPRDGREIYAWAACEFDAFRAIRTYLRKEVRLARADHLVVSYWRRGRSEEESGGHHDD